MRWIVVLLIAVLLAGAGFWYYSLQRTQVLEAFVSECIEMQNHEKQFLIALRSDNVQLCDGLEGTFKSRCFAYLQEDSSLCNPDDFDCSAIASKDLSKCVEDTCKAWITKDLSYCASVDNREWCENMISLNAEYFSPDKESCREIAKG